MPTPRRQLRFAMQALPVNITANERTMYKEVIEDAKLGEKLGYDGVWMIEHHFSDYYPCPSPLLFLSHVAAHCPNLSLGTSVLVLPWYKPMRLAEELHMLTLLTDRELHIGFGRGVAPIEYDAFDVDQDEARGRLEEGLRLIQRSFGEQPFDFHGEYFNVRRPVTMKPTPARAPNLYYGLGSPESATLAAQMGLPPLCIANFPDRYLQGMVDNWKRRAEELGMSTDVTIPIQIKCFIADTAETAREEAKRYLPETYIQQVKHYETDTVAFSEKKGYESFQRVFDNLRKLQFPENLDPYLDMQLIGTADMVKERLEKLADMGFNYFIMQTSTIGLPMEVRHRHMRRFAEEVRPHFTEGRAARELEPSLNQDARVA